MDIIRWSILKSDWLYSLQQRWKSSIQSAKTPIYKILDGGLYNVSFNANVTSATAGVVALGLFQDGILINGTTTLATIATAGDYVNVSFDKLIKICCRGDASLTIASIPNVLTGVLPTPTATETEIPVIQNANFSIVKKS